MIHEWNDGSCYRRDPIGPVYSVNGDSTVVDMCKEAQDP